MFSGGTHTHCTAHPWIALSRYGTWMKCPTWKPCNGPSSHFLTAAVAYVCLPFRLGHHDSITSIDALNRERAITSGGRDNSIRVWKIVEESQLVFNGHQGSIDCIRLVNEDHFISCGDDGYTPKH